MLDSRLFSFSLNANSAPTNAIPALHHNAHSIPPALATDTSTASPSAPPICWLVDAIPAATPCSPGRMPWPAATHIAVHVMPWPMLKMNIPGSNDQNPTPVGNAQHTSAIPTAPASCPLTSV